MELQCVNVGVCFLPYEDAPKSLKDALFEDGLRTTKMSQYFIILTGKNYKGDCSFFLKYYDVCYSYNLSNGSYVYIVIDKCD